MCYDLWTATDMQTVARVRQGHAPCKSSSPKHPQYHGSYCGRRLARRFGWAAPAYHKKEDANPYPRACRFSLHCDLRPDERLMAQVWT